MSRDKILNKLRKLKALALDPSGNADEAASAAARMAEMMVKYQIEEAEFAAFAGEDNVFVHLTHTIKPSKWRMVLANTIAKLNGVVALFSEKTLKGIVVYGRQSHGERAATIFKWLSRCIKRLYDLAKTSQRVKKREDFALGAATNITDRMVVAASKMKQLLERNGTIDQRNAMVLVDKRLDDLKQEILDNFFVGGKPGKPKKVNLPKDDMNADYRLGYQMGHYVELNPEEGDPKVDIKQPVLPPPVAEPVVEEPKTGDPWAGVRRAREQRFETQDFIEDLKRRFGFL